MIENLLDKRSDKKIESGIIVENMLDGYYRVNINGSIYMVNNQTSTPYKIGSLVSLLNTSWGRFIISGNKQTAKTTKKIIIRG